MSLAAHNNHIAPGDILLLRSKQLGFKGTGNLAAQSLLRGRVANYTHVAVVIGDDLIMDATPGPGVNLRRWSEVESTYDIKASRIARHSALASDLTQAGQVLFKTQYYYQQPYVLRSLVGGIFGNTQVQDQAGLVCSQFIAIAFSDMGLFAADANALATLPDDIDAYTQTAPWRQFPLEENWLVNKDRSRHSPAYLTDLEAAIAQAKHAVAAPERSSTDDAAQAGDADVMDMSAFIMEVVKRQFECAVKIKAMEKQYLALLQHIRALPAKTLAAAALPAEPIGGGGILQQWREHFIDERLERGPFLHPERDATTTQAWHDELEHAITGLHRLIANHNVLAEQAIASLTTVLEISTQRTIEDAVRLQLQELTQSLLTAAAGLISSMPEHMAEIIERNADYRQVMAVLPEWAAQQERGIATQAVTLLNTMIDSDKERLVWLCQRRPELLTLCQALQLDLSQA